MKIFRNGVPSICLDMNPILKKAENNGLLSIAGKKFNYVCSKNEMMILNSRSFLLVRKKEVEGLIEELQGIKEVFIDES